MVTTSVSHEGILEVSGAAVFKEGGFPGGRGVKNLPANAGDKRGVGSIPGLARASGVENGNLSFALKGPWTEEPGRPRSVG